MTIANFFVPRVPENLAKKEAWTETFSFTISFYFSHHQRKKMARLKLFLFRPLKLKLSE
jgi:hypothetical protein